MTQPIHNANTVPLNVNSGTMPNLAEGLYDWFQNMTFTTIVKTIVNFAEVETLTTINFMGIMQPMSPRQLMMKPDGQRSWRWFTIHAFPFLRLNTDEIITFTDGISYRVMGIVDYTRNGYVEYHCVADYTP